MPALDDHIDDLLGTYFYHVTTPEMWEQIRIEGLKPDQDGIIRALTTNQVDIVDHYATQHVDATDIVVIRFNPCNLGISLQQEPYGATPSTGSYIQEIRASIIGPLLLEKDSERKIEHRVADLLEGMDCPG